MEDHPNLEVKEGDLVAEKYRVDRVLGEGGMGVVVAATHTVLGDRVALKFLLPSLATDETTAARFLREARAAAAIKSPNVARVLDVGTMPDSGSPYMVMELMDGHDLGVELEHEGPLPEETVASYCQQACEALAAAHSAGVVHRDIKPSNLFLTQDADGSSLVKVLDFGISKVESAESAGLTQTQTAMGSPLYMSPEQMRSAKTVDARTDVWSLGVVMFELLTGEMPFMADSMPQLCALVLEAQAPSLLELKEDSSPELAEVVARCLQKDPADRYQTVAELAGALAPFAGARGAHSAGRTSRILGVDADAPPPGVVTLGNATDDGRLVRSTDPRTRAQTAVAGSIAAAPPKSTTSQTGTSFGRTDANVEAGEVRGSSKKVVAGVVLLAAALGVFFMSRSPEPDSEMATSASSEAQLKAEQATEEATRKIREAEEREKAAKEAEAAAQEARDKADEVSAENQAQAKAEAERVEKEAEEAAAVAAKARRQAEASRRAAQAKDKAQDAAEEPKKGNVFDDRL